MKSKEENKKNSDSIIKSHVIFSMTAGAIPLPIIDFIVISAIQIDMIKKIANFHAVDFDSNRIKTIVSSIIGTSIAKLGASAVKAIPGIGTIAGISAQVLLSGASTYALGKVFDLHFSDNGKMADLDTVAMKRRYSQFLAKGQEIVKKLKKELKNKETIIQTISKLKELKDSGAITEKDFESTKKKLLEKIV